MKKIELRNKKQVIIRRANKGDAPQLINYLAVIGGESDYLTFGANELQITIEQEEAMIEVLSGKDNALFLVAEVDGTIIGNLNFQGGLRERVKHIGEFGVSVRKEFWHMGIGRELITFLIDWAKDSKVIRKINLRVRSDNHNAIQLYQNLGFDTEGIIRRDFCYHDRFYDAVLMGKLID